MKKLTTTKMESLQGGDLSCNIYVLDLTGMCVGNNFCPPGMVCTL